uniref:Uncharacterized protein n=1 Tax=Quercus lobata TaxID=97700 RepID=A0A7N2LCJ9_QUELO
MVVLCMCQMGEFLCSGSADKSVGIWKREAYGAAASFTLGGEGWISNLIVYLIQVFNLKNINAAQISNIVSGSTNLLPVIGAIVADSFFGTFSVAAVSACISLLRR